MFRYIYTLSGKGGRSGYPKFLGRVIRVFKISGFENRYPKLHRVFPNYPNYCVVIIKTHTPY
jgi:hypothetical protein